MDTSYSWRYIRWISNLSYLLTITSQQTLALSLRPLVVVVYSVRFLMLLICFFICIYFKCVLVT